MTSTLNLYWTAPQKEDKAAKECRQAGFRAYVPKERVPGRKRPQPTARSYVAAEGKPCEAKDVGKRIGPVARAELRRLYVRTSVTQRKHTYAPGDAVSIKRGPHTALHGTVVEIHRAHWYDVRVTMLGKSHVVKLRESDLVRLHPGS